MGLFPFIFTLLSFLFRNTLIIDRMALDKVHDDVFQCAQYSHCWLIEAVKPSHTRFDATGWV